MLEALRRNIQGVGADIEIGKGVKATTTCDRCMFHLSRDVGDRDIGILNDGTCGVGDGTLNTPRSCELGVTLRRKEKDHDAENSGGPAVDHPGIIRSMYLHESLLSDCDNQQVILFFGVPRFSQLKNAKGKGWTCLLLAKL